MGKIKCMIILKELQRTAQVEVFLHSQIPTAATTPWERSFLSVSLGLAAIREFRNSPQAKKIKQPGKKRQRSDLLEEVKALKSVGFFTDVHEGFVILIS